MSIVNGNKYVFNTTESGLKKYNGTKVEIIRTLTDKECDIEDVGNMYKVKYHDGYIGDVFEDELEELYESCNGGDDNVAEGELNNESN